MLLSGFSQHQRWIRANQAETEIARSAHLSLALVLHSHSRCSWISHFLCVSVCSKRMCPAQIACCGVIEINYEPHLHCGWLSGAVRSGLRAFSTPNGICLALIGDRLRRRQEKFVRQLAAGNGSADICYYSGYYFIPTYYSRPCGPGGQTHLA